MAFDLLRVVERREDPRRERRWTAAIDELEQLVQVDAVRPRQPLGEIDRESGAGQSAGAPPHPLRSLVHSPAVDAHAQLAPPKW